jgi:hypothetical protein
VSFAIFSWTATIVPPTVSVLPCRRDIGHTTFTFQVWGAGEPSVRVEAAKYIAWRVAFSAVPRALDEVLSRQKLTVRTRGLNDWVDDKVASLPQSYSTAN